MEFIDGILYGILAVLAIYMVFICIKTGRFRRSIAFCILSGATSLGLLWVLNYFGIFMIELNLFTLSVSGILGLPGVLTMLVLKLL